MVVSLEPRCPKEEVPVLMCALWVLKPFLYLPLYDIKTI